MCHALPCKRLPQSMPLRHRSIARSMFGLLIRTRIHLKLPTAAPYSRQLQHLFPETSCRAASSTGFKWWRRQPSESVLWELLFESPQNWWDYRQSKRTATSPDFRHRTKYYALFLKTSTGRDKDYIPNLHMRIALMDTKDGRDKPMLPPITEEAWQDLFQRPWLHKDMRHRKRSDNSPDFVHSETNWGLWMASAPQWVWEHEDALNEAFIGNKPRMPILEGSSADELEESAENDEDVVNDEDAESGIKAHLKWSAEQQKKGVDVLMSFLDHDHSEEATAPEEVMKEGLMRHQKQGLAWMLKREAAGSNPAGGMLCDEQGLGKTMTTLALIASNPHKDEQTAACADAGSKAADPMSTGSSEVEALAGLDAERLNSGSTASTSGAGIEEVVLPVKATLIVAPKTVLRQWVAAIAEWTKLKVLDYSGTARDKHQTPESLAKYDIVLASYNIVLWDSPIKSARALFGVKWWRLCCDEAQHFKQHQTQIAAAMSLLQVRAGGSRWILSGTPIQNSPEELFSYLHFLRFEPFCNNAAFQRLFKEGEVPVIAARLREIVSPIMLRRTKATCFDGKPIMQLPERRVALHPVTFSPEEQSFYNAVMADFKRSLRDEQGEMKQAAALSALHQLRRACDHPWLLKNFMQKQAEEVGSELEEDVEKGALRELVSQLAGTFTPSAKLIALMEIIRAHQEEDKIIVYSQWTSMLDLIEATVADEGMEYRRLDGSMPVQKRQDAVRDFEEDPDIRIFLVSLLAGKEGLNLAFASRIVLMEPHFNPMHEEQAIDRAHRFKQRRTVHAHKLYIPGTVEEKMLELQQYKTQLTNSIIRETGSAAPGKRFTGSGMSMEDLQYLLGTEVAKAWKAETAVQGSEWVPEQLEHAGQLL